LPHDELKDILILYEKVTNKALKISKTFGIEGKKLLTPDDEYQALKEFNNKYEGTTTPLEDMHLEYQKIIQENPDILPRIKHLPLKVFSGKEHPSPGAKAVFFCYSIPGKDPSTKEWTDEASITKWYLYDIDSENIIDKEADIIDYIRCNKDTPRRQTIPKDTLIEIREKMDKYVKNTYLKKVQAPIGIKAEIKAWMELS